MTPGELTLRLEQSIVPLTVTHVADCPDLGPECFDGGPPPTPYYHHVDELLAETALDVSLGLTPWLAVDTRWSLRVSDVNPTYSELDGTPKQVPNDIHHHDETLVDVTDPWIVARLAAVQGQFVGNMRLGFSLPLGRTEEDPYRLGREGKSHEHLQAGTGTVVPIIGFGMAYVVAPVTISFGGVGFFNAYENAKGFRAPTRVYATHRVSVGIFDGVLTPFAEATLAHETEEYWHGEVGLEGSNVRSEIYVGGGAAWRFFDPWTLELTVRGRVASLTDAPTFKSLGLFSLAVSTSFDLWDTDAERREKPAVGPVIHETEHDGVVEFDKE
ncbi:MAG TPA: hypothetical protein VL400_01495 [Polyangiaceae bacterium]|nr:hypothetical protein [Polyangiaceae bacterium]